MSILRVDEIRKMSEKERREELDSLTQSLMKEYGMVATGGSVDNPGRIKEIKRTIARIKTIEGEKRKKKEKEG